MSWYRLYRPQTIADLHLISARTALGRIRDAGVFSHAYLFAGPKGTGKTSGARIIAKMLNCEKNAKHAPKKPFNEPCNTCKTCQHITDGSSLSVVEMDAASHRGIDDIRALRDMLGLAPAEGKYTVYIIDEVHMLTTEAFNALLKVLEEPPKHVVFILATTELHKLPETIVSRCTMIPFTKATAEELTQSLQNIAKKEAIKVPEDVLRQIAQRADGSFRDAVKLFEQIAQEKKTLTAQDFEEGGSSVVSMALRCVDAMNEKDVHRIIDVFSEIELHDVDVAYFHRQLISLVHTQLLQAIEKNDLASSIRYTQMLSAINIPVQTSLPKPILSLELACLSCCLQASDAVVKSTPPKQSPVKTLHLEKETIEPEQQVKVDVAETATIKTQPAIAFDGLTTLWPQLLGKIKSKNTSLEALLKAARPHNIQGNTVTLEVFYSFHKDQLGQERYRKLIEQELSELCGTPLKLLLILGERKPVAVTDTAKPADETMVRVAEEVFL